MKNIVVLGASGHAKVVIDIIEKDNRFRIAGIVDPLLPKKSMFMGYPVIGHDDDLPKIVENFQIYGAIVAIGDNSLRQRIVRKVSHSVPHLSFVTAIHPRATIGTQVTIGPGTVVMAGAVINSDAKVGSFCILNSMSLLEHDSCLGNFASLAPRASTGGNCDIGEMVTVGMGAVVLQGLSIGTNTIVGASAMVNKDLPANVTAYGLPARIIRHQQPHD